MSLCSVSVASALVMEPITACIACHGNEPPAPPVEGAARNTPVHAIIGSHTTHMSTYAGIDCSFCHVQPNAGQFGHRNGNIDMAAAIRGGAYSRGASIPQNNNVTLADFGTCSNTACHGAGNSPQWGSSLAAVSLCYRCHGNPLLANNAPETNAHQTHLQSNNNYSQDVACSACHTVPASIDMTGADGHLNSATADVNVAVGFNGTSKICSTATCHGTGLPGGSNTAPNWTNMSYLGGTSADCGVCHGNPPTTSLLYDHAVVSPGVCNSCHYHDGTGSPAQHMNGTLDVSANCSTCHQNQYNAAHTAHLNNTSYVTSCDLCHGTGAATGTHVGHKDLSLTAANRLTSWAADTCANTCHNGGTWSPTTGLGALTCTDCHAATGKLLDQGGYPASSAKHTLHIANATYVTGSCDDCHGTGATTGTQTGHKNGTVQTTVAYVSGTQTCTTTCHIANTTGDWTAGGSLACADCHGAVGMSLNRGEYPPASGRHALHVANTAYVTASCDTCHGTGAQTGGQTGHKNGSTNYSASITSYAGGTQTCINSCHLAATTGAWTTTGTLVCADCHDAVGKSMTQGGYPPASAKHAVHLASNTYVQNDCADCHGANATAGTHSGHKNGSVENTLAYASATQTCTNSCHIANTTGDWTVGGSLDCLDCHTATYIAAVKLAMPTTGLHDTTPSTSGTIHDQTLNAQGCAICHTATPSTLHLDGTFQNSAPTIQFAVSVGFTDGATPSCATTCHADSAKWSRVWHENSAATDGTECVGCHGTFTGGWASGVVPNHNADWDADLSPELASNHTGCKTCHGFNSATDKATAYNVSMHRNGSIEMNSDAAYNQTNFGCDTAGCHGGASVNHRLADSGWTIAFAAFGAGGQCNSCHGYPPATGAHTKHTTNISAEAGMVMDFLLPTWDAATHPVCATCHDMSTTNNHSMGNTDPTKSIAPSAARTFDGGVPAWSSVGRTCSNISCHFQGTPKWNCP
ncbi:MAG: CxxxxCH/CxxCH domain-containing protein [Nitrospirae bacterium]|nr:CxxxxCH/CxxCH domain-containing protein [Nitrospirota bacterium]